MTQDSPHVKLSLTRRRFLQGSVGGVAGLTAWLQGWPRLLAAPAAKDEPSGQMTWAVHVTIAPTWFDPAETPGNITPFMLMYALHDAMFKPMPNSSMAPSLVTQWHQSTDGLTYDFQLRQGVTFHNGDPVTAQDYVDTWNWTALGSHGAILNFFFERFEGYEELNPAMQ
jgi:ABC-type transport system substrate-binding protein